MSLESINTGNSLLTPTEQWKEATKHCTRDLVIQSVALAALALVAVAMLLVGVALMPAVVGIFSAVSGAFIAPLSLFGFIINFFSWTNYGKVEEAQKIVDHLREHNSFLINVDALVEYGFIEEDRAKKLKDMDAVYVCLDRIEEEYVSCNRGVLTSSKIVKYNTVSIFGMYLRRLTEDDQINDMNTKKLSAILKETDWSHLNETTLATFKREILELKIQILKQRADYIKDEIVPHLPDPASTVEVSEIAW